MGDVNIVDEFSVSSHSKSSSWSLAVEARVDNCYSGRAWMGITGNGYFNSTSVKAYPPACLFSNELTEPLLKKK